MQIRLEPEGTAAALEHTIAQVSASKGVQGLLILACDENGFTPGNLDPLLHKLSLPVFGGVFPQILYQEQRLQKGSLVVGWETQPRVHVIPALSDNAVDFDEVLEKTLTPPLNARTMFVFVDGFASRISALVASLFNLFGLDVNYIGGGAGSLSMQQKPCLITNQGLLQDCALLVLSGLQSGIGVSHGWRKVGGPHRVTEADRNKIISLDWQPAFSVYKEIVESHSKHELDWDNFFEIAKCYPFGIMKLGAEEIVRDPVIKDEQGHLICVGEVPVGSFVDILHGEPQALVEAARSARLIGEKAFPGQAGKELLMFIDCISRVLFLQEDFGKEIEAVRVPDIPLVGALTIGEIANSGKDYLEFYNKTSVVGVLGKGAEKEA